MPAVLPHYILPSRDLESSRAEAELVIFSAINDLLTKTDRHERAQGELRPSLHGCVWRAAPPRLPAWEFF